MKFGDDFFKKVEKKTNVNKDTILNLAQKLQNGNMKDEKTIREVIDTLSIMTGKKVDKDLSDKIVNKIINDKVPDNVDKMFWFDELQKIWYNNLFIKKEELSLWRRLQSKDIF